MKHPLIGRYLSCYKYDRHIEGEVVHYIRAGSRLTKEQMEMYAQIDSTHRSYRSVRGPARVDRIVLARPGGYYWIAPLHIFVGE